MDQIYSKCKTINSQFAAVTGLVSACLSNLGETETKNREDLAKWEMEKIENILTSESTVFKEDGVCLVQIGQRYPDQKYLKR